MAWRTARALDTLLEEINTAAPRRNKKSDGSIGDAAHASRSSDHNPWVKIGSTGIVTARDYTHDPAAGADCNRLAEHLRKLARSGDPRIKYIIWNRRIASSIGNFAWRVYTGPNPHTQHLHLSVVSSPRFFDSTAGWGWHAKTYNLGERILRVGMVGPADVNALQALLNSTGLVKVDVDDAYGPKTAAAVREVQQRLGIQVDGEVGPQTIAALRAAQDPFALLVGAIRDHYLGLPDDLKAKIGKPTTPETPTRDNRGRFNHFEHGSIFWTPDRGPFLVYGNIHAAYHRLGFADVEMGFPVSPERDGPLPGTREQDFEGGILSCNLETGQVWHLRHIL